MTDKSVAANKGATTPRLPNKNSYVPLYTINYGPSKCKKYNFKDFFLE
jgi:hypothetical protein